MKKLIVGILLLASSSIYAGDIGPGSFQDEDVLKFYDSIIKNTLNRAYGSAGLAVASATDNIKTVTTINYTVDGVFYSLSPGDITVPALGVQAASTYVKYMVSVNSLGVVSVTKGNASARAAAAELPALADGYTPIGYFQVATNASTTYTAGTTGLTASGLTVTYVNIGAMTSGKYKMSRLNR